MTINYTSNSELIRGDAWSDAIGDAQRAIIPGAIKTLQSYTPVDTGRLTNAWKIKGDNLGINVSNETYYGGFINDGTRYIKPHNMVEKSMPQIMDDYENKIIEEIEKR